MLGILLESGATDPLVRPSTGRPLTESDEPYRVVRDFLEAVQRQDRPALGEYLAPERVEGADLEIWARYLPARQRLLVGYRTDSDATLEISGPASDGVDRRWAFIMERPGGEDWRIRTYWDPGPDGLRRQ